MQETGYVAASVAPKAPLPKKCKMGQDGGGGKESYVPQTTLFVGKTIEKERNFYVSFQISVTIECIFDICTSTFVLSLS